MIERTGAGIPDSSSPRLRVGCIGSGDIVRATHLPVLKAMPEVEVVWIMDPNEDRAKEMAKVYGVPSTPVPKDLTKLPSADVYLMACPFGVRDPYYEVLRERSASIYVEKPFARTEKRHAELCAAFPEYALSSGLMMRCWGPNMMAREIISQQLFGPLRSVRFGFGKPGLVTQGNYYFETGRGGAGMLSEVGIHGIDAALYVSKAESTTINSVHTVLEGDLDLHTEAKLQGKDAQGRDFTLEFTVSSLQETIEGIEIECEYATLSYPLPGQGYALIAETVNMDVTVQPKSGAAAYVINPRYVPLQPMSKFLMFRENWGLFLEGVVTKTANLTSAKQAQLTTTVIEELYKSGSVTNKEAL